mgnify:CR=1 FL=1
MAITNATRLSDFAAGIGTEGAILKIDNANQRVGIGTQLPSQMLEVAGIVTATAFYGDGSNLEGVASAGLGTAIGDSDAAEAVVYYTNDILSIGATLTINVPPSSSAGYTQYRDIKLDNQADLIVETGDDFIPDVLGLSSSTPSPDASGNGVFDEVYADIIKNKNGLGAPAFANGLTSVGIITASKFIGSGIDLTNLNATQLTSGTIPGARFPATLPAASGANLTSLNGSNISAGIVTSSVLGGGTANATTFLNGHGQFAEAGGGAWTLLSTTTITSSTEIEVAIPQDGAYDEYAIKFINLAVQAGTSFRVRLKVKLDGSLTSGNVYQNGAFGKYTNSSGTASGGGTNGSSEVNEIWENQIYGFCTTFMFYQPTNTLFDKSIHVPYSFGQGNPGSATDNAWYGVAGINVNDSKANKLTSMVLYNSGGGGSGTVTWDTGKVKLYGIS